MFDYYYKITKFKENRRKLYLNKGKKHVKNDFIKNTNISFLTGNNNVVILT